MEELGLGLVPALLLASSHARSARLRLISSLCCLCGVFPCAPLPPAGLRQDEGDSPPREYRAQRDGAGLGAGADVQEDVRRQKQKHSPALV